MSRANRYETVAAGQTAQVMGGVGAAGSYLDHIIIQPATVSPGVVTLIDGSTNILAFPGGANSLTELKPIQIEVRATSVSGAWKITTGANVSVVAVGVWAD